MKKISNPKVAQVFAQYPRKMKQKLLFLRSLIFSIAAETEKVGLLEETLKWGEPAYLSRTRKVGILFASI
jgi:hypothetical protein